MEGFPFPLDSWDRLHFLSRVMRKPMFCIYVKTKTQINFAVTPKLMDTFFLLNSLQPPNFLNPKFQASSHLLLLYSPVCVGPGGKPRKLTTRLILSCSDSIQPFLLARLYKVQVELL